jgi:coenzyme F420-dependent glucose-6-phosphate dehydrogenase
MRIGYWTAQEQHSMRQLLDFVVEAERAGFQTTGTSDHFHPWWHDNGYGNFTWVWITAAAERTKKMHFMTGVTAPIYRYHPAIIAQAFASLDELYPGRIALGIGSGEAMNEVPLGFDWPRTGERLTRTQEAIEIIEKLWTGEFVNFAGKYYKIRNAKLYTPPVSKVPLYMAASGEDSATIAGRHCNGLITFLKPDKAGKIFSAFDKAALESGKDPANLAKIAEYKISFAEDYDSAFESTKFWRATEIDNVFSSTISDPRELQQKALQEVPDEKLKESIQITTSIEDCIKPIEEYFKAGFTRVYIHSTSPNEIKLIREFGKKVLPYFATTAKAATA